VDPRLLSIHLEGNPRRDAFRQARARVEHVAGGHTIAGEVRLPLGSEAKLLKTLAPGEVPVKAGGTQCWLLDRGKQIPLKVGLNSIGRLPDNDVVIDDATVSRRHCAIVVHSDLTIEVHDVASKNGTTVNGAKINGPTRLRTATRSACRTAGSRSSCSPGRRPTRRREPTTRRATTTPSPADRRLFVTPL